MRLSDDSTLHYRSLEDLMVLKWEFATPSTFTHQKRFLSLRAGIIDEMRSSFGSAGTLHGHA